MTSSMRGMQSIRTMKAMVDKRRTRTTAGALLELSAMASERLLLQREMARWERRYAEIQARLADIGAKENACLPWCRIPRPAPRRPLLPERSACLNG